MYGIHLPMRIAEARTNGQDVVEPRAAGKAPEYGAGQPLARSCSGRRRRQVAFDAQHDLAELMLDADLAADHGRVVIDAEAGAETPETPHRRSDHCQPECDAEVEATPIPRLLVHDPLARARRRPGQAAPAKAATASDGRTGGKTC